MNVKKNSLLLIFILFSFYGLMGVFYSAISFNWTFQDWLINYQGGFIRRGFFGEIISILSNLFYSYNFQFYFGVKIHLIYFYIFAFITLAYYILLYNLLKKEIIDFEKFFIILSPLSISFIIYNQGAIARKEILLFILLLSFIFLINCLKRKELSIIFLIIFFPLLLLIHEGFIFFTVIFLTLYLFQINLNNKKKILFGSIIFLIITLFVFLITVIFKGNTLQVEEICLSLQNYVTKNCPNFSAIAMLSNEHTLINEFKILWQRAFKDSYLIYYPLFAIIGFLPLIKHAKKYYFNILINNKSLRLNFMIIVLALFLNTIPLYLFTHDWGRWLHISYMLTLILFFCLKKNNNIYLISDSSALIKRFNFYKLNKIILITILVFYSLILNVSYFGGYNHWLNNYSTISNYFKFCLKVIKTIPHIF